MTRALTVEYLRAGMRAFRERPRWPRDFHAHLYKRQADRRAAGLSEQWWSGTLPDLRNWLAIRPLSEAVVRKRGLAVLARLNRAYELLPPVGPDFSDRKWSDLTPLFELACEIKPLRRPSPVFPSKLCHFIRPDLYVVVDREMMGGLSAPYARWWQECADAWRAARPIHDDLRKTLADAAPPPLRPEYPFATKITELCLIGAKAKATHGLTTR